MRLLSFLFFITLLAACKQTPKASETFEYGKLENGVYRNDFFQFDIPVPASWDVQDEEQMKQNRKMGEQIIASKNEKLASDLKDLDYASLLSVFKYRKDTVMGSFNPSFMFVAENLARTIGINKPVDYLRQAQNLMKQSGLSYQFTPGFDKVELGGREFARMQTVLTTRENNVKQSYYATIINGFALVLIVSYADDEQMDELRDVINKMKFR